MKVGIVKLFFQKKMIASVVYPEIKILMLKGSY
jgi:hypothetical protein